jgi:hypothetical protein
MGGRTELAMTFRNAVTVEAVRYVIPSTAP